MRNFNFVILYVENVPASAAFYTALLDAAPAEASPGFAMFAMPSGVMFGLWKRDTVEPKPGANGGSEIAFTVADAEAVKTYHADWQKRGLPIAQAPTDMDFGRTFVALDPDGHRLRVFAPAAA